MLPAVRSLKLKALLAICQIIDQALDLESSLEAILRTLSEELSMKRATVTLLDPESETLTINASYGLTPEEQQRGVYTMGEGVTGRIFQTAQPYFVPDISREPLFLNKTGTRKISRATFSFIGVPIMRHGDPMGVLNVDRLFADDVAPEEDIEFLMVVATLIAQFISLNEKVREREASLRAENVSLKYQISRKSKGLYMVGDSSAMTEVQRQIQKVAPTKATVLLLGESGVGKTLIARIIHRLSDRKNHAFIKVNCASIPDNLIESELFGVEKGAYTGATHSRAGRFEEADHGTIFLDEVGELPLAVQAKLLRVIQEREFERLGSVVTRRADVRILAATNKDLEQLAQSGEFRPDLYYRLNVFPLRVPALRERSGDVPGLLNHFLSKVSEEYGRSLVFSPEALDALTRHLWPGNVREMENLIERLVIMTEGGKIAADTLDMFLDQGAALPENTRDRELPEAGSEKVCPRALHEIERAEVINALRRNGWIQYKAASALGLTPRQMGYRVRKMGLEPLIAQGRASLRK